MERGKVSVLEAKLFERASALCEAHVTIQTVVRDWHRYHEQSMLVKNWLYHVSLYSYCRCTDFRISSCFHVCSNCFRIIQVNNIQLYTVDKKLFFFNFLLFSFFIFISSFFPSFLSFFNYDSTAILISSSLILALGMPLVCMHVLFIDAPARWCADALLVLRNIPFFGAFCGNICLYMCGFPC